MTKPTTPTDCFGNVLKKGDFVTIHFNTVPIFRVIAVENGGLHTANGMTPAVVRVICDMTLRQMPGVPFSSLVRLVEPGSQQLIESLADSFSKS
jgi:hypothetical protein